MGRQFRAPVRRRHRFAAIGLVVLMYAALALATASPTDTTAGGPSHQVSIEAGTHP